MSCRSRRRGQSKRAYGEYPGLSQITDTFRTGKREIKLNIKPASRSFSGFTLNDLARQVRQAFYGEEAQRIQRGRDDIRVMVRYPYDERTLARESRERCASALRRVERCRSAKSRCWRKGRGYSSIRRVDRKAGRERHRRRRRQRWWRPVTSCPISPTASSPTCSRRLPGRVLLVRRPSRRAARLDRGSAARVPRGASW